MTEQHDTRSGLYWGWLTGDSNWGDDVNRNFQILAYRGTNARVINTLSAPPANPTEADSYIVGANPTGAWSTFAEKSIVAWGHTSAGSPLEWVNFAPIEGLTIWSRQHSGLISFDENNNWVSTTGLSPQQQADLAALSSRLNITSYGQIARGLEALGAVDKLDYVTGLKNKPTTITTAQATLIASALQRIRVGTGLTGDGVSSDIAVAIPYTQAEKTKLGTLDANLQLPATATTGQVPTWDGSAWTAQAIPSRGNAFTGITVDTSQFRGTGVDENTKVQLINPFLAADRTKLDGIETGATADQTLAEIVTMINTLSAPGTADSAKISYNVLTDVPQAGTGGTLRTGNQTVDLINAAGTTNLISSSKISGLRDGTVTTSSPVVGDGQGTPVGLDADTRTKLGKLTTTQPSFAVPLNYQANLAEDDENSFNFVRGKDTFMTTGVTEVFHDTTLTGKGTRTDILRVARPWTGVEFSQAEKTKLAGIESGAKDDLTANEITALINSITNDANKINASQIVGLTSTGQVQSDWTAAATLAGRPNPAFILNKPDIPSVPSGLSTDIATLKTQVRDIVDEDDIVDLITGLATERADDLTQAMINLTVTHNTVTGDTINFNDQTDIVKSVNNVEAFAAGKHSLLEVSDPDGDYDPIIIDNDFILAKSTTIPPIEYRYINDSTRGFAESNRSQEFILLRNGRPVHVAGTANPKLYNTIRVGRSTNNSPLIAKMQPTSSLRLTIKVAELRQLPSGGAGGVGPAGPKGDKGDTGDRGPKGDKGDQGDAGSTTLAGLTDTRITNPATGEALKWDGTRWTNQTDATSSTPGQGATTLRALTDTTITNPATGQVLKWNGTRWTNQPDYVLPPKLQDFSEAISGNEGWQDDTGAGAATVSTTTGSLTTTLTQAKALTYGTNYTNPNAFRVDNIVLIVRIPTAVDDEEFRLAEEEPPGDASRQTNFRYGDLFYQNLNGPNWIKINTVADGGYHYYRAVINRLEGDGRLYIQKFGQIVIDTEKVDSGYAPWAGKTNTDEIPASKLPPSVSQHAQEMVNQARGLSIGTTNTAVRTSLTAFTRQLTLGTTDHGVFFTATQARAGSGATIALDSTVVRRNSLSFMSDLRSSTAYDNSAGAVGNGIRVATFDVNNSSGVKQGTVNCYIARNAANQVGTYNSYVPEPSASGALTGQISIQWEVSLLRTDSSASGGGSFTQAQIEEFALDRIARAFEEGDDSANVDLNFDHSDPLNRFWFTIKAGSLVPADIKRDGSDTTRAASLSTWQTLFGITSGGSTTSNLNALTDVTIASPTDGQGLIYESSSSLWKNKAIVARTPGVPIPVALPELFITRQATDPSDVVTIRDTRGYLNETLLVGTTLNFFKGGSVGSQTALAGNPYTIKARLSGGFRRTTQRVQLNKAVTFTSSAAPVSTTMFNADVYYCVIGARAASELPAFHLYDDAESFITGGNSTVRGVAFNPVRSFISTIDGGSTKRHLAYTPTGGGTAVTVYTQNLEGDPKHLAWDPDGRYLYVSDETLFRVYDFGASTTPSSLTISRVTSKEFDVTAWFSVIEGIHVTATEVLIFGKRFSRSTDRAIDRFTKAGVRSASTSDIFIDQTFGGEGLFTDSGVNTIYTQAEDGDNIDTLARAATTNAGRKESFDFKFQTGFNYYSYPSLGIVGDTLYMGETNSNYTYNIKTGTRGSTVALTSTNNARVVTTSGNWIYALTNEDSPVLYRQDRSAQSPTISVVSGTIGFTQVNSNYVAGMAILSDNLYILTWSYGVTADNRLQGWRMLVYPLTGSSSAGYTAFATPTVSVVTFDWTVPSTTSAGNLRGLASDGHDLYTITSGTSSTIGTIVGRYNTTSHQFTSVLSEANWGSNTRMVYDPKRDKIILAEANRGFEAYDFNSTTQLLVNRSKLTSFPLGHRQGEATGFGYNSTADKFYIGNHSRVNVYDKRVTGADRTWVHDRPYALRSTNTNEVANSVLFANNRVYVIGNRWCTVREWPTFRFVSQVQLATDFTFNSSYQRAFYVNGYFYCQVSATAFKEFSPSTGEAMGTNIIFAGTGSVNSQPWVDAVNNRVYLSGANNRVRAYPLPATGKITTPAIAFVANSDINIGSNYRFFIYNDVLYALYTSDQSTWRFRAYSLMTRGRSTEDDLTISSHYEYNYAYYNNHGFTLHEDVLYAHAGRLGSSPSLLSFAFVRAV